MAVQGLTPIVRAMARIMVTLTAQSHQAHAAIPAAAAILAAAVPAVDSRVAVAIQVADSEVTQVADTSVEAGDRVKDRSLSSKNFVPFVALCTKENEYVGLEQRKLDRL